MPLFLRGVALPFNKGQAPDADVLAVSATGPVYIPLAKEEANAPTLCVEENSTVAAGQVLCHVDRLPVFSTIAGKFIGTTMVNHPLYGSLLCAVIKPTRSKRVETLPPVEEPDTDTIIEAAAQACIYDELDGIPLADKLRLWRMAENDQAALRSILVADATENDIYGSSAWCILKEQAQEALYGLQMAARALRFSRYHITTMLPRNRRRALKRLIGRENVFTTGDEYPVTVYDDSRDDVFCIGIQACAALSAALQQGQKHTHTILTVAGDGVPASRNVRVPFGMDLEEVLQACGADPEATVILGDAMTGVPCQNTHFPLLPGITTVLVMQSHAVRTPQPCIGCGRCATVCHAGLLPYEIVRRLENMHYERLRYLSTTSCDGCGACSYVCPAGRDVATQVLNANETRGTMFLNWGGVENE